MGRFFNKCKDCPDRQLGCHDKCPHGYLEEKARYEEIKKAMRQDREFNACAKELSMERNKKWLKKK